MDRKVVGLIGAVGVLASGEASQAAVAPPQSIEAAMQVHSYADLLRPIPNAVALAAQREPVPPAPSEGPIEKAQVVILHHHHHHHHHHHWRHRRWYHRHWHYY